MKNYSNGNSHNRYNQGDQLYNDEAQMNLQYDHEYADNGVYYEDPEEENENNYYEDNNLNEEGEEEHQDQDHDQEKNLLISDAAVFNHDELNENGETERVDMNRESVEFNQNIEQDQVQTTTNNEEEPIYIMTLEVDKGKSESIKIFSHSNPSELSFNFCKQYDLDFNAMNYLTNEIDGLIKKFNNKETEENVENVEKQEQEDPIIELEEEEQVSTEKNKYEPFERRNQKSEEIKVLEISNNRDEIEENEKSILGMEDNTGIMNNEEVEIKENTSRNNFSTERISNKSLPNMMQTMQKTNVKNVEEKNYNEEEVALEQNLKINNQSNMEILEVEDDEVYQNSENNINHISQMEQIEENDNHEKNDQPQLSLNDRDKFTTAKFKIPLLDNHQIYTGKINYEKSGYSSNISPTKTSPTKLHFSSPMSNHSRCLQKSPSFLTCITNIKNQNKNLKIHERLFRDAEIRRRLPKGRVCSDHINYLTHCKNKPNLSREDESMINRTTHQNKQQNYGEYLYYRGKMLKEEKMRQIAHIKVEMEAKNAERYTFKPKISDYNPITEQNRNNTNYYNSQEYLISKEEVQKQMKESEPISFKGDLSNRLSPRGVADQHTNNYTPKTRNNIRNVIVDTEANIQRKFLRLEKLRSEINSQYTFTPNINRNYQFDSNFIERQNIYQDNISRHKQEMIEENNRPVDEYGVPLFKPRLVSKSKYHNRNGMNIQGERYIKQDVFTQNYEFANRYRQQKENLMQRYNTQEQTQTINNESEIILHKVKLNSFTRLFKELDADQDDLITAHNITLKNIPSCIKKIINPIIVELKEQNETLNEREFVQAMFHLYQTLSYEDRKNLIYIFKEKPTNLANGNSQEQQFNFRPEINAKSKKLATKAIQKLFRSESAKSNVHVPVDSESYFRLSSYNVNPGSVDSN